MKKRFLLTALALTATAAASQAGPLCQRLAANRAARVEARQTRCTPVADAVKAVAAVPAKVVQARPVVTFAGDMVRAVGTCRGGACR